MDLLHLALALLDDELRVLASLFENGVAVSLRLLVERIEDVFDCHGASLSYGPDGCATECLAVEQDRRDEAEQDDDLGKSGQRDDPDALLGTLGERTLTCRPDPGLCPAGGNR